MTASVEPTASNRRRLREMPIKGTGLQASDGAVFPSNAPAPGDAWAEVPETTEAVIDRALRAAGPAMATGPWTRMNPAGDLAAILERTHP